MMKPVSILFVTLITAASAFAQDTGWIGMSIADGTDRGALIRSVEANSPAERAGLKANDVIVLYNKQDVVGAKQLTRLVSETPVGRTVDVTVRRENRDQTLKVTTEKAPFELGGIRFQTPDLTPFRDHIALAMPNVPSVRVLTTVSLGQEGIRAESLTPQLRDVFGVKSGGGVLVASVDAGSAAARAELKAGDVITAVDGRTVSSPAEFNREMQSRTSAYTLKVVRDKQEREIRVEK
jgi:serine protease Do